MHSETMKRRADQWRAGCLDADQAKEFEQAMAADPGLAARAAYGARLARGLDPLPELARLRARRAVPPRRVRWPRVLGAGMAAAALAGLSFGLLPTLLRAPAGNVPQTALNHIQASPQLADAVQNLDFYEWLAEHPGAVGQANGHDGTA